MLYFHHFTTPQRHLWRFRFRWSDGRSCSWRKHRCCWRRFTTNHWIHWRKCGCCRCHNYGWCWCYASWSNRGRNGHLRSWWNRGHTGHFRSWGDRRRNGHLRSCWNRGHTGHFRSWGDRRRNGHLRSWWNRGHTGHFRSWGDRRCNGHLRSWWNRGHTGHFRSWGDRRCNGHLRSWWNRGHTGHFRSWGDRRRNGHLRSWWYRGHTGHLRRWRYHPWCGWRNCGGIASVVVGGTVGRNVHLRRGWLQHCQFSFIANHRILRKKHLLLQVDFNGTCFPDFLPRLSNITKLSCGFNPFEKYSSIWIPSPQVGVKIKNIWNHHLSPPSANSLRLVVDPHVLPSFWGCWTVRAIKRTYEQLNQS